MSRRKISENQQNGEKLRRHQGELEAQGVLGYRPEWLGPECLLVSKDCGSGFNYLHSRGEWEKHEKGIAKER